MKNFNYFIFNYDDYYIVQLDMIRFKIFKLTYGVN